MLTWEELVRRIKNDNLSEDLRLIAQLLIESETFYLEMAAEYCKYPEADIRARFEKARQQALTNPINYFQQQIK